MNIHVVEHTNNFVKLHDSVWESGWWNLDESSAQKLIGGEIYFHKTRMEPSFYGGTLLGYRVEEEGQHQGRIVFKLQYRHACRNVKTGKSGWQKEIKIIRTEQ